jgi:hypothetical protein
MVRPFKPFLPTLKEGTIHHFDIDDTLVHSKEAATPTHVHTMKHLHEKGYKKVKMVIGSVRVDEMHKILYKYNGHPDHYSFDHIHVVSAGDRDADDVSGMSPLK